MGGKNVKSVHEQNAKIFKAFCDERRLAILELLQNGEMCACELQDKLPIGQSTLSHHMRILCDSGIVDSRREGKWTHYVISEEGCRRASEILLAITSQTTKGVAM